MFLKLNIRILALPWQQGSDWGLRVTQNAYFSLITHTKQLLSVKFCDTIAGIGSVTGRKDRRTDMKVEIVM